jgi:hypothetical protein
MVEPKTIIGKNNFLFLTNDSAKELQVHCENLNLIQDHTLSRFTFSNYLLFVYPNKSLIYKEFLPDNFVVRYRPALRVYKNKFKDNMYDLYKFLKDETDVYYKTDTHINFKGNYSVYRFFINTINSRLNLNLVPKELSLSIKHCNLCELQLGIGDLTWSGNLGNQHLANTEDNYYYSDEVPLFYCVHKINNEDGIRFLDYNLNDNTSLLENQVVNWDIVSKYIIYKKNDNIHNLKVLFFYDSLLLHALPLYLDLFSEVYFVKDVYSNDIINLIKPTFVFEFRVERFLV